MRRLRDLCYAVAILAGLAIVYTSLGTLNGRLQGGFTAANTAWACSVTAFAIAVPLGVLAKIVLMRRRKHERPLRAHPSGRGWVVDDARPPPRGAETVYGQGGEPGESPRRKG